MSAHVANQDVRWFHVAVENPLPMEPREGLQKAPYEANDLTVVLRIPDPLIQGDASDEIGAEMEDPLRDTEVMDSNDSRVS
jgi:hypothetical protein